MSISMQFVKRALQDISSGVAEFGEKLISRNIVWDKSVCEETAFLF